MDEIKVTDEMYTDILTLDGLMWDTGKIYSKYFTWLGFSPFPDAIDVVTNQ